MNATVKRIADAEGSVPRVSAEARPAVAADPRTPPIFCQKFASSSC